MARTGRPPLPQNVRQLHGETRPSHTRTEAQPPDAKPKPPSSLSKEARKAWNRITADLDAMGILYSLDTDPLVLLSTAVATFWEAERHLQTDGYIASDDHGQERRNPWFLIRQDAGRDIYRLGQAFGMTPVARAHMAKPVEEPDQRDELFG